MAKEKLTKERAVVACIGVIVAGGSVVYVGVQIGGAWGAIGMVLGVVGVNAMGNPGAFSVTVNLLFHPIQAVIMSCAYNQVIQTVPIDVGNQDRYPGGFR